MKFVFDRAPNRAIRIFKLEEGQAPEDATFTVPSAIFDACEGGELAFSLFISALSSKAGASLFNAATGTYVVGTIEQLAG